jgi:hypothetical protein
LNDDKASYNTVGQVKKFRFASGRNKYSRFKISSKIPTNFSSFPRATTVLYGSTNEIMPSCSALQKDEYFSRSYSAKSSKADINNTNGQNLIPICGLHEKIQIKKD